MPVFRDESRNTFYVKTYYTDYTGARKQKMKRGFKLQREAKEWERAFLEKMQGTPDMTFQSLYDLYIEDMSPRLRYTTIEGKKNVFANRILPYFGEKPINQITPKDIRDWQTVQISAGYSDAYLDRMQNMLTTIFNYAVSYYHLPSNPCDKAGHMGKRTRSMQFWTLEQYNRFIPFVTDPAAHTAIQVLFYSGMRFGEMLALTPADIDFDAGTIDINKSYQHRSGGGVVSPPKTSNGIRTVTMPNAIMDELRAYIDRLYHIEPEERIFLFTKSLIRGNMKRGSEAAGIPLIRIHDLRHSHISHLIDLGFSAVAIADRVGHESIDITYRYSHLFPSKQVAMADRLDAVNASFEDCEEQDDDVEIMQTEETAPMIDMDAAAEKIISIDKYKAV